MSAAQTETATPTRKWPQIRVPGNRAAEPGPPAAEVLRPIVARLLGEPPPVAVRCWDGSTIGEPEHATGTLVVRSPNALRHLLYAPGELGLARAYVWGELDLEGDVFAILRAPEQWGRQRPNPRLGFDPAGLAEVWRAARRLGAVGPPLAPPPEEARLRGRRHSRRRDAAAVSSHYDVGNDFYRLLLGPTMTYSCGFWPGEGTTLDQAQTAKYELVSRKLGLEPGMRLLDVGCGWGGMVLHAARHHGVQAVGVTVSAEQHRLAVKRVRDAGLDGRVEVRLQDYRDITDGPFDAISSIGMFEHVGHKRMAEYLTDLHALLRPEGRLLNHAISRPEVTKHPAVAPNSFMGRYVFPDSALLEVGSVVTAMHQTGLEVRDVESLREHYGRTLRAWLANLEGRWHDAQRLAGPARARIWRLYLAAAALGFEQERLSVHQVLAVRPGPDGTSGLPATRTWLGELAATPAPKV